MRVLLLLCGLSLVACNRSPPPPPAPPAPKGPVAHLDWSALSNVPDEPENYHIVTFDLSPTGKGTEVSLTQENQNESESRTPQAKEELKKNWSMLLDGLKKVVED